MSEVRCGEAPYVSPDAPRPHERSESTKDRAPEPLAARSAALTGLLYDVPASSPSTLGSCRRIPANCLDVKDFRTETVCSMALAMNSIEPL